MEGPRAGHGQDKTWILLFQKPSFSPLDFPPLTSVVLEQDSGTREKNGLQNAQKKKKSPKPTVSRSNRDILYSATVPTY